MPSSTKHSGSFSSSISYSALSDGNEHSKLGRKLVAAALIALGIGVMGIGLAWKQIVPERSYWSEEQAKEHEAAFLAVKLAAESDDRRPNRPDPPKLVAARQRWEKSRAALEGAQNARTRTPILILGAGAILAGAGVVSLLRMPDADERDGT
jgi:hypothetical protein